MKSCCSKKNETCLQTISLQISLVIADKSSRTQEDVLTTPLSSFRDYTGNGTKSQMLFLLFYSVSPKIKEQEGKETKDDI